MAIGKFISPAQAGSVFTSNFALTLMSFNSTEVRLSWLDPYGNEDGFKLERSANGVNYSVVATLAANTLTYTHTVSVEANSTYYYRVRSYKGTSYSDYSNVLTVVYNDTDWYGIQIDILNSSPDLTRIGSDMTLHASLPVQSNIKACLLLDNGTVNYYLKSTDWTKKADNSSSVLDGTDGQVMIEIPDFYYKVEQDTPTTGKHQIKICRSSSTGFTLVPKHFVGAYEAAINRSTNKLASVVNSTTTYRGGNNTSSWDADTYKTLLNKPVSNLSRTLFRTYAQARGSGWNIESYSDHKWLYWFYVIEYATLNSQKSVDITLTSEGYKKGGIGAGVTGLDSGTWSAYNSYNPFVKCGASDSLASGSGEVSVASGMGAVSVVRYRGIENPFGHIWTWVDGANIESQPSGGVTNIWISDDPTKWNDGGYTGYINRGTAARGNGYAKIIIMGSFADIIPTDVAGSSSTFYCDYYYQTIPAATALYGLSVGGSAYDGATAGFAYSHTIHAPSTASANIGSRLRFLAP
jgi:hypothetical protein